MSRRTVKTTTTRSDTPAFATHTAAPAKDEVSGGHGWHDALPATAL
jgi:hypothetical protein